MRRKRPPLLILRPLTVLHPRLPEHVKRIRKQPTLTDQRLRFAIENKGVPHDKDKTIGAEYAEWLRKALRNNQEPPFGWRVALAISLIEGFAGRTSGAPADKANRELIDDIWFGSQQLRAEGWPPGEADKTAAREILARRKRIADPDDVPDERVSWALDKLRHRKPRKPRKPPR
jgi:hypothetical protein